MLLLVTGYQIPVGRLSADAGHSPRSPDPLVLKTAVYGDYCRQLQANETSDSHLMSSTPPLKADLHCHSHYSDGKHSPSDLLERARENGVTHLAITDHDCVAALTEISGDAHLTLIPGVEISCAWGARELHVVGLGVDPADPALTALLESQQASRRRRILAIADRLAALGIDGLPSYLETLPCHALTRTHVADFLIGAGHCRNQQKAFKQYLGSRGRAFVPGQWCSLPEAIRIIQVSGGIPVLAHPGRYRLGKRQLETLVREFRDCGGEAMETSYGNIDPMAQRRLRELAEANALYQSQGSDFHSAGAHWTDIGKFPAQQPGIKNAIWDHPGWHF